MSQKLEKIMQLPELKPGYNGDDTNMLGYLERIRIRYTFLKMNNPEKSAIEDAATCMLYALEIGDREYDPADWN